MVDVARLLQTLHPFREPPPPPPVTPYLLMLGLGCVVAAVMLIVCWRTMRRRTGLRRTMQAALATSRGLSSPERLAAQAKLLRRLVLALKGDAAARTVGAVWLETLDRVFDTRFFTLESGRVYGEALYRPAPAVDVDALDRSLEGLIAKVRS